MTLILSLGSAGRPSPGLAAVLPCRRDRGGPPVAAGSRSCVPDRAVSADLRPYLARSIRIGVGVRAL